MPYSTQEMKMLTPEEKNKLDELNKKKQNYTPLTEKDILAMQGFAKDAFDKFNRAFMASQPFWNEMCGFISLLGKHNTKLLMEIEYLRTELNKFKK